MDIVLGNVHMLKKPLPHKLVIAFRVIVIESEIFVQIKADHIAEGEAFLFMEPDQFTINGDWSRARRQAKDYVLACLRSLSNQGRDLGSDSLSRFIGAGANLSGDPFELFFFSSHAK